MRRKNNKTKRTFVPDSYVPPLSSNKQLEEHGSFRPGDDVFFNHSVLSEKISHGTLKEIIEQQNGKIVYCIWDLDKGMWRHLLPERVYHEAPPKRKKGDK